jgi:hypothetical protein
LLSHYQQVLDELREKNRKLASKYINELYYILNEEEHLTPVQCRSKIESDCSDIWSKDTIRKYLPLEAKNETKRKAGKISAEIKKRRKAKEARVEKEAKPLIVNSSINDSGGSSDQTSVLIDDRGSGTSDRDNNDNSVGMNPTENGSVRQKGQGSSSFQKGERKLDSGNFRNEDPFSLLVVERLKDEALQEFENRIPIEGFKTDLEPLAQVSRETIRVLEKHVNDLGGDLRIKCFQLEQLAKESAMRDKRCIQLQRTLDSYSNKIIKGTAQVEFGTEFLPVNIEYSFKTDQISATIPQEVIERLLAALKRR